MSKSIYDDGLIEMVVICNNCKHTNYHTITHSSTKNGDKTTIDFSFYESRYVLGKN